MIPTREFCKTLAGGDGTILVEFDGILVWCSPIQQSSPPAATLGMKIDIDALLSTVIGLGVASLGGYMCTVYIYI